MTAAVFLAFAATMGVFGLPVWGVLPLGALGAVVAAHTPPERAEAAREAGTYWKQYLLLVPMMTGAFAVAYGLGHGISLLIFGAAD